MSFYRGKKVLVTGGTGMIGRRLVHMLLDQGASVRIVSLDDASRAHPDAEFVRADLTNFDNCLAACRGMDLVFQLIGVKGSPAMTAQRPASFFVPTLLFNLHMMEAARQCDVERYLLTSTVGVYAPAEVFREDDVWRTFPSPNDKFAGWAKRMSELQAEAYSVEYAWDRVSIVRPANVYGPYDNFDPPNAMVVPSLIKRALDGENPFVVWGDGSPIRDFIHADDCARGTLLVMEKGYHQPVNLGSGTGTTIREVVEIVTGCMDPKPEVVWDTSKPSGDARRVMDMSRAKSLGFEPRISIGDGIRQVMDWYREHRHSMGKRYDVFTEPTLLASN